MALRKDRLAWGEVIPRPLAFDRLLKGRSPVSESRLLHLPTELLELVLEQVPLDSLPPLALANSDCRQLARSRQFARLCLKWGKRIDQVIDQLETESKERKWGWGCTQKPALGPCIRHLIFTTSLDRQLVHRILLLFRDRTPLPHLEFLRWEDRNPLKPFFFESIMRSSIKHLRVHRAEAIWRPAGISQFLHRPPGSLQLKSLFLEMTTPWNPDLQNTLSFCTILLHLCSATLESLTWGNQMGASITTDGDPTPRFTSLRHLRIHRLNLADHTLIRELVHDDLISLDVDTHATTALDSSSGNVVKFQDFGSFLVLEGDSIPETPLQRLGDLLTLEHLHLSAGEQHGWRHTWPVDHFLLRENLQRLTALRRLAISRDTYPSGPGKGPEGYYLDKWAPPTHAREHEFDIDQRSEEQHRDRMVRNTSHYVELMPQLEWLYLGQIIMAVEDGGKGDEGKGGEKMVKPLLPHRNSCRIQLKEMFGWKGLLPPA
ncbi:MAG: hypothetical protein Q9213_007287 [Squamulea squamosa]